MYMPGMGVMGSSMRNMAPFPSERGYACMPTRLTADEVGEGR